MEISNGNISRRRFLQATAFSVGGLALPVRTRSAGEDRPVLVSDLPVGAAPAALDFLHFPDRLHACVWRNWQLVPIRRLAEVLKASPEEIISLGRSMGLSDPPPITEDQQLRSAITVLKRNWHLLPYSQLLELLGWTPAEMAFSLREDDGVYWKMGELKPNCDELRYAPPGESARLRAGQIAGIIHREFPLGVGQIDDPLFSFVGRLAEPGTDGPSFRPLAKSLFAPRFCYSYFALYGDPLLDPKTDPYPDGYLARLAAAGVDGVWLQAVLYKLAPFPWGPAISRHFDRRLKNLLALVERAARHGIRVYLYLNEPRAMPLDFFRNRPELKGVVEKDRAALCTSTPEVRDYLVESVASICRAVPGLGGFFTITASENLTNCWSHQHGAQCPRCGRRGAAEVIAEVNNLVWQGIRKSGSPAELMIWDWGWPDGLSGQVIPRLPVEATLMSVSEWDLPIERGGIKEGIHEYSISAVGPGPRARQNWKRARERGMKLIAKIQAGNTWEISAIPYIPALANVAQHAANLRDAEVDGLMLGWTLGGYPSPNLEVVAEIGRSPDCSPIQAMDIVARKRFGAAAAPLVVKAWQRFSVAFSEFPFGRGIYQTPLQVGPSNLLWEKPTGYRSTPVGFPYDDINHWRGAYPVDVYIGQLEKIAGGFEQAIDELKAGRRKVKAATADQIRALDDELSVAEAAAVHFRSSANQCRFVRARQKPADSSAAPELSSILRDEIELARKLYNIQMRDSRIGFEASNQYYYVPIDLAEKVINCEDLMTRWLPTLG